MDGESIVIMSDLRALQDLGHQVYLFCLNTEKHFLDTTHYDKMSYWSGFESINSYPNSVSTIFKSAISSFPFQIARFFDRKTQNQIIKYIAENEIECVVYQGLAMTLYLDNLKTIKKIYRAHNLEHKIWIKLSENAKNIGKKLFFRAIAKSLKNYEDKKLGSIDKIITLSEIENHYFENYYLNKSEKIAINIATSFNTSYNPQQEGLLFLGSLDWQPNREGLTWFLREIYPYISHIPLTIAGKGDLSYKDFPNIKIVRNFKNLEALLSSHRLMIVPLLSGAGIRIKILEAMKYGLPSISTHIGAEGIDSIDDDFMTVDSSKEWIDTINQLYNDYDQLLLISNNLINAYKQNYSSTMISSKWRNILYS